MAKADRYDRTHQFTEEVWGLISRHKLENVLGLQDMMIALEFIRFELMLNAFESATAESDEEGDCDGQ